MALPFRRPGVKAREVPASGQTRNPDRCNGEAARDDHLFLRNVGKAGIRTGVFRYKFGEE